MNATTLLGNSVEAIDSYFGAGYAARNPAVLTALLKTQSLYRNAPVLETTELANDPPIIDAILKFMQDRLEWKGTPLELLTHLRRTTTFDRFYTPKRLSMELTDCKTGLASAGVEITRLARSSAGSQIKLRSF